MPMHLYFNELSAPQADITVGPLTAWKPWAMDLARALVDVGSWHDDLFFGFVSGAWHEIYANKPFHVWIESWIGRDFYRKLVFRIRNLDPNDELTRQVYFSDSAAIGATHAHQAQTWVISFGGVDSQWRLPSVEGVEHVLSANGEWTQDACKIRNICDSTSADLWRADILDWGKQISNSAEISSIHGFPIHMYSAPSEHGVPHVHLVDPNTKLTIAKYRVSPFERMEGKPTHDIEAKAFVTLHRQSLLNSWARCMAGGHPYKIV